MRVVLAQPRGFCAGVERAIEIVERALEKYGPPIYVRHEIVHNRHVVERLRAKGARFVDEIDEVPPGAVTEALKARSPSIVGPDTKDICYATQNRQRAARELAKIVDVVLVVGAPNSSNSNRLREIAAESGVPSYLIEDARALDPRWLEGVSSVRITARASG